MLPFVAWKLPRCFILFRLHCTQTRAMCLRMCLDVFARMLVHHSHPLGIPKEILLCRSLTQSTWMFAEYYSLQHRCCSHGLYMGESPRIIWQLILAYLNFSRTISLILKVFKSSVPASQCPGGLLYHSAASVSRPKLHSTILHCPHLEGHSSYCPGRWS